jgi:hypothetical protein
MNILCKENKIIMIKIFSSFSVGLVMTSRMSHKASINQEKYPAAIGFFNSLSGIFY